MHANNEHFIATLNQHDCCDGHAGTCEEYYDVRSVGGLLVGHVFMDEDVWRALTTGSSATIATRATKASAIAALENWYL